MSRGPRLLPEAVGTDLVELEAPPDWKQVFGFDGPLELELGSGKGGHALEYARRHPHVRYLAIEWRKKYARDSQAKADELGLKNVRFLEGDARMIVPKLFAPGSLDVVRLQFPDPWWKRAHYKRSLVQPDFLPIIFEKMRPGARFDLRTDVKDRGERMLLELEKHGFVNPLGPGVFHPYDPEEVPSSREHRYLAAGEPVYRARLVRPQTPASL